MLDQIKADICAVLNLQPISNQIEIINEIKRHLHSLSPFKGEPVDCVLWVPNTQVQANAYNPNSVAPPEMELLRTSIVQDGYTQPIVAWDRTECLEVVDGFHRNRVGKECTEVTERVYGYLPVVVINSDRQELGDRMVSTIRHNRARGKHNVDSMSDIVVELKRRNWTDAKIQKNLGMEADEILRLCQISGLTEMFKDTDFSQSWDVNLSEDADMSELDDSEISEEEGESDED